MFRYSYNKIFWGPWNFSENQQKLWRWLATFSKTLAGKELMIWSFSWYSCIFCECFSRKRWSSVYLLEDSWSMEGFRIVACFHSGQRDVKVSRLNVNVYQSYDAVNLRAFHTSMIDCLVLISQGTTFRIRTTVWLYINAVYLLQTSTSALL